MKIIHEEDYQMEYMFCRNFRNSLSNSEQPLKPVLNKKYNLLFAINRN
jgi:hypothetical protein